MRRLVVTLNTAFEEISQPHTLRQRGILDDWCQAANDLSLIKYIAANYVVEESLWEKFKRSAGLFLDNY